MKKIILLSLILVFIICFVGCTETKTYSATCKTCHKTYSYQGNEYGNLNSRNVKCIRATNMCKNCYENFCYATGRKPKNY